jgi:hypothetical protein
VSARDPIFRGDVYEDALMFVMGAFGEQAGLSRREPVPSEGGWDWDPVHAAITESSEGHLVNLHA